MFAPKKLRRVMSYTTGWFLMIGLLAMGATCNFITANFILGVANLNSPTYALQRWHTVLLAYSIAALCLLINIFLPRLLDKMSRGLLVWNVCSFVIVVATILACNEHKQPTSFVFKDFVNFSGFNPAYTAILGLLQAAFGMCCYDVSVSNPPCDETQFVAAAINISSS